jgi:hypothetical protein
MSDINKDSEQGQATTGEAPAQVPGQPKSPARRRLIKLGTGVVPVVATLASKPALAWHCQAPSAWGSELLSTSLAANPGHQFYGDEVWTCSNWSGNTTRSGVSGIPWAKLCSLYPGIKNNAGTFDYKKVTIAKLQGIGVNCAGATSTAYAYVVLGGSVEIQKRAIAAQLNHLCLSTTTGLGQCVKFSELNSMGAYGPSGTYKPSGDPGSATWATSKVNTYLKNNYIAVD